MRVSQLAAESGIPVATIKYYLREGLLHEGRRTAATQADYDGSHVDRLRLVRALVAAGGVSIAEARRLLDTLSHPPEAAHDLLGAAHQAVAGATTATDAEREDVRRTLESAGWDVEHCEPWIFDGVAVALGRMRDAGFEMPADRLRGYVDLMRQMGRMELEGVPTDSAEAAVRYVVLGTVLVEPLLLALRRVAEQSASAERFGTAPL